MALRMVAAVLFVAMAGCGDDGGSVGDGGPGSDASPGTDGGGPGDGGGGLDSGMADAGGSDGGGSDGGGSDGGGSDGGGSDGGGSDGVADAVGAYVDAELDLAAVDCECSFSDQGYDSVEACAAGEATSTDARGCLVDAAESAGTAELAAFYECAATTVADLVTCLEGVADCDESERDTCHEDSAGAFESCPTASEADFEALYTATGECTLGEASGCPDTTDETGTTGSPAFTGSTFEAGDDVTPSCGGTEYPSPDRAISWTAPAAGDYVIDTQGSDFDTVLAVLGECEGSELACNDDTAGLTSEVVVTVEEGESILIVVDGFDELAVGDFEVNITAAGG